MWCLSRAEHFQTAPNHQRGLRSAGCPVGLELQGPCLEPLCWLRPSPHPHDTLNGKCKTLKVQPTHQDEKAHRNAFFGCSSCACRCGVNSTALAITVQVARAQGFLGGAASHCEAGARVSANVGLPVFHGAQLAIDATLVSPLRADGEPHRRSPRMVLPFLSPVGARSAHAQSSGGRGRARLVVIAAEMGGRSSEETQTLLRLGRSEDSLHPAASVRARQSWLFRWSSLLSCAAARAFASSLLGLYDNLGAVGDAPSISDVIGDFDRAPFTV